MTKANKIGLEMEPSLLQQMVVVAIKEKIVKMKKKAKKAMDGELIICLIF